MKKLNNIFIISLAAFFLLAGNGVNLIEYCCNLCEEKGVEVLIEGCHDAKTHACCSDHSEDNTAKGCNVLNEDTHECHLTRYTLDDIQESSSKISSQIFTATTFPHFSLGIACPSVSPTKNFPSPGYVYNSGRSLLSHICVLTI